MKQENLKGKPSETQSGHASQGEAHEASTTTDNLGSEDLLNLAYDHQEGNMNNGTLGGNFESEREDDDKKKL